jgi:phage-related protein
MDENTNYIGVAMGMDVSDLKAGLTEASKRIGEANADFRAASSSMEDWTKSTEGLQAKIKQLDTVLAAQKSKLAGLKAEYEKVAAEQGENSTAARNLYIRMQNQQAVVNQTQREFDNYKETLEQVEAGTLDLESATLKGGKAVSQMGDGANEAGGKLDGFKSIAGGVVAGVAAIGAAAVAAVGSFLSLAESTRETRENFNKLETGFTTAGHSAEDATNTYRELYGILGDEGQATEAAAHLALLANNQEDLSKWTDIATGVYATFGDSLPIENLTEAANETAKTGKLTGGLADALNWAGVNEEEFQAKLDAATTEQERQALITETLNGLYSEQSDKFKELNGDIIAAREAEAAMTQAMAELGAIAEPIMTTLKMLAVDLLEAIKPAVELIGQGLKGAFEGTAGAAEMLAQGLGGIVNTLVERVNSLLPMVADVALQLIPSLANTLLEALPTLLNVVIEIVLQIINMLTATLPQIVAKVVEIIPILIDQLMAAIPQLLQAAITFFMAIVQALPTIITNLINELPKVIDTILDTILEAIPLLLDGAIRLFTAIINALPVIIQALIKNLPRIIDTIIHAIIRAIPLLLQGAIQLFGAILDAIPVIIPLLIAEIPNLVLSIVGALLENIPALIGAGAELIGGVVTGMLDPRNWKKGIESVGKSILNTFKSIFKINSPSRLMRDEIGEYLGEGIGVGVLDSIPTVKKQLGKFAGFVTDNIGGIKSGLSVGVAGAYAGAGGVATGGGSVTVDARQTINYNGALSRKQIMQQRNDNYVAVEMYLKQKGAI